ncbi:carbon-nitrogen hydrolase family protein [Emticicia sp. SJ17W-69]|uniref:carbon-nitrogen hydrolase family protein n=1 Tax=Emticicia sp. SJ17W-69 TaxID=3421657 RepID=UPI003EBD4420
MNLKIASAQYPIRFHKSFSNWQNHTQKWVENAVKQDAQLLVFPEYGSMELVSLLSDEIRADIRWQVRVLNTFKDGFCSVYADLAKKYNITIVAPSFPVIEGNFIFNRAFVFSSKGLVGFQDKFFMTRFENEVWGIHSAPKKLTLFEGAWGSFGIQICYDVEFGLGSQLLCSAGASLIVSPSCTETIRGATRVHVGARARALENQCYVVVSQTVGNAAWSPAVDINYGFAAAYCTPDKNLPEEGIIASNSPQNEEWLMVDLDFDKIRNVRADGQVLNFKDIQNTHIGLISESVEIQKVSL